MLKGGFNGHHYRFIFMLLPFSLPASRFLAGRRVNCFYLIVADTNAHVVWPQQTAQQH